MPDPVAVNSMFARIARRYDVANRLLSCGLDVGWRRRLTREVKERAHEQILDLATGSGDVAFTLSRALPTETRIIGMDFCAPMLDEARIKQRQHGSQFDNIQFVQGDAMALELPDNNFDAVTISFGLRNLADRAKALGEMQRVLKPGGHLFVLEFSQPYRWFAPFYFFYLRYVLPSVAGVLTGDKSAYQYLNRTIEEFPGREKMAEEIKAAGFSKVTAIPLSMGSVALHICRKPY